MATIKLLCLQSFVLFSSICSLLHTPASAVKHSYVVYLGGHSHGPEISELDLHRATETHYDLLSAHLGSRNKANDAITYSYNKHINGFAAILEEEEAETISRDPKVISVFQDQGMQLHTTRSWEFLGVEKNGKVPDQSIWKKANFGEDAIIANIDTGVWPEAPSFADDGMGPIPSRWKGLCQNNTKDGVPCNRKLIGAKYFDKAYLAWAKRVNETVNSTLHTARDTDGHGTHTLSTAAGSFASNASIFGYGKGTAKGGSPKARVATYKVCWPPVATLSCLSSDALAAFDEAINDGVDVISLSLGLMFPTDFFKDPLSIGAFHAVQKGILVVGSAGNSGPFEGSVTSLAPWVMTVGASTMDREFQSYVSLGNNKSFKGESLAIQALPEKKYYPLISGADAAKEKEMAGYALLCMPDTLDPLKVQGKIVACVRGGNPRVVTGIIVGQAGASGMILCNEDPKVDVIDADTHTLPATQINYTDGQSLLQYINSTKSPVAYITPVQTKLNITPSPVMFFFSSKGPNTITPEILKPDITAPGVNVLAAYTQAAGPSGLKNDTRSVVFNTNTGTSMASPHAAGVAGLLKTLHPDWSPAAIKSAMMTTASTIGNDKESILNSSMVKASPFSYGAGHISPDRSADPGLVYDLSKDDYFNFLCGIGYNATQVGNFSKETHKCPKSYNILDFNYPSISVPNLSGTVIVSRRVKNVGTPSVYQVMVNEPHDIYVSVDPKSLDFKKLGEEKMFNVTLKAKTLAAAKEYVFGELIWSDGSHHVRSTIAVKAK